MDKVRCAAKQISAQWASFSALRSDSCRVNACGMADDLACPGLCQTSTFARSAVGYLAIIARFHILCCGSSVKSAS